MSETRGKTLSRRDFLKLVGAVGGSALLSACGVPSAPTSDMVPSVEPPKPPVVEVPPTATPVSTENPATVRDLEPTRADRDYQELFDQLEQYEDQWGEGEGRQQAKRIFAIVKEKILSKDVFTVVYAPWSERHGEQRCQMVDSADGQRNFFLEVGLQGGAQTPIGKARDYASVTYIDRENGQIIMVLFVDNPAIHYRSDVGVMGQNRRATIDEWDRGMAPYFIPVDSRPATADELKVLADELEVGRINQSLGEKTKRFLEDTWNTPPDSPVSPTPAPLTDPDAWSV